MIFTVNQAEKLFTIARDAISANFEGKTYAVPKELQKEFNEVIGVFVSLYDGKNLVGSIGFPEPDVPLAETIARAAASAASEDPRFPPVKKDQFKDIIVDISFLSKPEEIKVKNPSEYPEKIKTGKDGLMIRDKFGAGVLLPQVAVEWGWDAKEFLNNTCKNAALEPDCWNNMKRNVYKFQVQRFVEENGKIIEKK